MKRDITSDFIDCQKLLRELGFKTDNGGFSWHFELLNIILGATQYNGHPHILLSLSYNQGKKIDAIITQDYGAVKQVILSNTLTDLRIKALNRNVKLYCILNGIEYRESTEGYVNCMTLKLNPDIQHRFS